MSHSNVNYRFSACAEVPQFLSCSMDQNPSVLVGNCILRGKSYHSFAKKCIVLSSLIPYKNDSRDIELYSIGVVVIAHTASYTGSFLRNLLNRYIRTTISHYFAHYNLHESGRKVCLINVSNIWSCVIFIDQKTVLPLIVSCHRRHTAHYRLQTEYNIQTMTKTAVKTFPLF